MHIVRPSIISLLFILSAGLLVAAYFCSYQSGCLFDGKQGYGDLAASEPYTAAAYLTFFGSVASFCFGYATIKRWSARQLIPALIVAFIIGLPVFLYFSFDAAVYGTQQCHPA